ncbi:MAG: DNA-directed RNA polymerase subunit omega [Alphaproteobacteria bacterium]|nr:DNA-directed RNA polymerase subunit omega [Alphaproteobacteria bacterium]MBF0354293.1 DNA-directed RNA polymerase subunit omega [Alphaproteobacteria bacterium]
MARVTVEDCVTKIPNRFELVMLAAQRARDISTGAPLTVDRDNDKNPVIALREIADETVSLDVLRNSLVQGLQKHVENDQPEDDNLEGSLAAADMALDVGEANLDEEVIEDGLTIEEEPEMAGFEDIAPGEEA